MREQTVYQMQEANARRSMLLLRQFEFLNSRQKAFEDTLAAYAKLWFGFGLLRIAFGGYARFLFNVDNRQKQLLAMAREEFKKASEKVHIEPVGAVN